MKTRIITIEIRGNVIANVREGDRSTGQLCWDEMLGHIAAMTFPLSRAGELFAMQTRTERMALRNSIKKTRESV